MQTNNASRDRQSRSIVSVVIGGVLLIAGWSIADRAFAQSSTIVFKNFHRYPPSGLWEQQLSGTRDGVSLGAPITSTSCTGVADPKTIAAMQKLGEANAASCKTTVITDTERLAQYDRTCMVNGAPRIIHSTMKSIDDKKLTIDTRDESPGIPKTVMHSSVTYLGTCTAAASKPSAEECAEIASGTKDLQDGEATCAQAPAAYRAQCLSRISASRGMIEAMQARCR